MAEKGIGSRILGIFVETGEATGEVPPEQAEAGGQKSPAETVAELAKSSGAPARGGAAVVDVSGPPLPRLSPAAPAAGGAPLQFDEIFRTAGMDPAELDRVKKAEELLKSLPASTPDAVKRQIVEASLKAFGFEIDKIVQAARNQNRALDAYVKVNETATAKAITDATAEIGRLEEKIQSLRADIEKRTASLSSLAAQAQGRKAEVQKVLDFFHGPAAPAPGA